jgi:hypothetical protein
MFHADITGESIRMIYAGFHTHTSGFRRGLETRSEFIVKGFEFIADLNNGGKIKSSRDDFVNLFVAYPYRASGSYRNRPGENKKVTSSR